MPAAMLSRSVRPWPHWTRLCADRPNKPLNWRTVKPPRQTLQQKRLWRMPPVPVPQPLSQRLQPSRQKLCRVKPMLTLLRAKQTQNLHQQRPWLRPGLPSRWSRCAAMTAQAKRKPKRPQAVMADAMAVQVIAMPVRVIAQVIVPAVRVTVVRARASEASVSHGAILQTVANVPRAWAIPPSARNARPWSAPRCRCASWPHKPTARP